MFNKFDTTVNLILEGLQDLNEIKKGQKDSNGFTKCWPGYHAAGTKKGSTGKTVRNCVPNEGHAPTWQKKAGKSPSGGLNKKGIASYRHSHPGSHLSMAVTTKPSKLKPGSKAANRRKSFCARMSGVKGPMKKPNGEPTRKALALRKWHCHEEAKKPVAPKKAPVKTNLSKNPFINKLKDKKGSFGDLGSRLG